MSDRKPHKCPICEGEGKLYEQPMFLDSQPTTGGNTNPLYKICHGCGGNGIVWEPEDNQFPYPSYPVTS